MVKAGITGLIIASDLGLFAYVATAEEVNIDVPADQVTNVQNEAIKGPNISFMAKEKRVSELVASTSLSVDEAIKETLRSDDEKAILNQLKLITQLLNRIEKNTR